MSGSFPTLTRPPIVEAVVDFDCDLPQGFELKALEKSAREKFEDRYPLMLPRLMQEMRLQIGPDGPSNPLTKHGLEAFLFNQSDRKQLVQVRRTGFSFNRLAPYAGWDAYLEEIQRVWRLYCEIAQPIRVRTLRLRYINRIEAPLKGGQVNLDKYLKLQKMLVDDQHMTLTGFLSQYSAVDRETGHQVAVVLTA